MKIVFMGSPEFAIPSLEILLDNGYNVVAVVTQPDKPKGRGKKVQFTPVKEFALNNSIKVIQPKKIRDKQYVDELKVLEPDLFITCAFGQILSKEILDIPKYGCINVHGSLLPKYRGAGPIQWAIINGENKTGITTMLTDVGLDTGDMLLKDEIEITDDMTAGQLHDKMSLLGAKTLLNTLKCLEKGELNPIKQLDSESCYAPMISKNTGKIDWSKSAKQIKNLVRGTNPWPIAFTCYRGKKVKIFDVDIIKKDTKAEPGTILNVCKDGILVATGDDCINITMLQFENKKCMTVAQCICGNNIEIGEILV